MSYKSNLLTSSSDSNATAAYLQKIRRPPRKNELVHSSSVSTTVDDETCSTDSNTNPTEELVLDSKKVKTKHKLLRFGRKLPKNSSVLSHAHSE
ncbi:hypothetical protein PGB90_004142 [Kerria lacca]